MNRVTTLVLLLMACSSGFGQYTPNEPKEFTLEEYSRNEIRRYLLMIEPNNSEVYYLVKQSRKNQTWSIILYSTSGLFVLGGISALAELDRLNDNGPGGYSEAMSRATLPLTAIMNFSAGGVALWSGIRQTQKSRRRLLQAVELWEK